MAPKIVNGANADITDFPFQVALFDAGTDPFNGQYCGGVIIDATHVITAAHCVYNLFGDQQVVDPSEIEVLAGTDTLSTGGTQDAITKISFDPHYDPDINDFDIAVITLADALWTDSDPTLGGMSPPSIAPIPMLTDDTAFETSLTNHDSAIVTGWGDTELDPPNRFPDRLQKANVPLVDTTTCTNDYVVDATITPRLFCAGDAPGTPIEDSCQGDSGGPIVVGTDLNDPSTFKLAGLVDSGNGCAQRGFPGIYNRISNADFQTFIAKRDTWPQAPQEVTAPVLSGGNAPGDVLSCASADWTGQVGPLTYEFANTSGQVLGSGTSYTIQQSDYGTSVLCRVEAQNEGGYGFGRSNVRFVPRPVAPQSPAPPPPSPPPPGDGVAPKLRVSSKKCTKTSCTVKVKVRDAAPSSGLGKLRATLNYTRKVRCKSRKHKNCHKTAHRSLRAGTPKKGVFTIVARHLKPGTGYRIALVPFDKAGNRPQFSTITSVRTKPRHTRFPFF